MSHAEDAMAEHADRLTAERDRLTGALRNLSDSLERFRVQFEHDEDCPARTGGECYGHDEPPHEELDMPLVETYADLMAKELAARAVLAEPAGATR